MTGPPAPGSGRVAFNPSSLHDACRGTTESDKEGAVHRRFTAGVVKWYHLRFPTSYRGFNSRHPHLRPC